MRSVASVAAVLGAASIAAATSPPLPQPVLETGVPPVPGLDLVYESFSIAYEVLDADRVAALYTEDALYLPPGGEIRRGREALRASFGRMFERRRELGETMEMRFRILARDVSGSLAVDVGTFEILYRKDGDEVRRSLGKFVVAARLEDDGMWRFAVDAYSDLPADGG